MNVTGSWGGGTNIWFVPPFAPHSEAGDTCPPCPHGSAASVNACAVQMCLLNQLTQNV